MSESEVEDRKCWTVHFGGPAHICVDLIEAVADIREFAELAGGYVMEVLLPVTQRPEDLAGPIESALRGWLQFQGIGRNLPHISIIQVYQGFHLNTLLTV
jgi:hypothetical protein